MTRSHRTHTVGDTGFFLMLTVAHAAVAIPALRLWAAVCERSRRGSEIDPSSEQG